MLKNLGGLPALVAGAALLAACNGTQEIFRPFNVDETSVSADAKQRVIISASRGTDGQTRRIVCAEPSPDAVSAIAASLGANLSAKIPVLQGGQALTPEGQVALQYALAEQVAYIGVRNSTIQLLRDGLYRACEAYMNGAIGDFGYALILANYGRLMVALLTAEGMTRPQFTGATILTSQANAAGGSADEDNAQSASASAQGGGTASSAQGGGGAADGDADAAIMEMVHDLADPHRDIQKSVIDIAIACFMWAEETPMRSPKGLSRDIQLFCDEILGGMPDRMEAFIDASLAGTRPPADSRTQTASLVR
jgi:hypothetical protein